ncbi:MAG: hypothetical protein LLG01_03455 [Planctomycetaceae bacterium]|nr:hypothetical protein [Planctomycetaceae bacterium]
MLDKTAWFAQCGWGVFCHYLGSPPSTHGIGTTADQWNRQVDAFDVAGLAEQLEAAAAPYFFITVGQGSGHYCAPNATYDALTGLTPSKCSRRDLVSDLYDALHGRGIELLVYTTGDGSWGDFEARKGLKLHSHWNDPGGNFDWDASRNVEFQTNWENVNREWSLRWGTKVRGWWVDGAYHAHVRYPENQPPNFETFAAALRAGNPDAIVAFNPGVKLPVIHYTRHEDFTCGEVADALPACPGAWVEKDGHKARYHLLSYLGSTWCGGAAPRFPDDLAAAYTAYIAGRGGVMTWDVPIEKSGLIPAAFADQLKAIGRRMASAR